MDLCARSELRSWSSGVTSARAPAGLRGPSSVPFLNQTSATSRLKCAHHRGPRPNLWLGVVEYRAERPEEFPAIGEMLTRIMRPETAALVDRIREGDRYLADLSRVAVADDGHVIRFVMLSRLDVIGEPSRTIAKSDRGVGSTEARPLGRLAIR